MSDLFNPYKEFLDLDTAPKCPTYYELLGISDRNECTHDLVENGRITALAKMRAFKPGGNAAVWAALLDEVALASTTLLDADLKATYDNQLTTDEVPTALDLVQRLGPIERIDASPAASAAAASPVDSMAPSHLQSGAAVGARVAAVHPIIPTAVAVPVAAHVEVATPIAQPTGTLPDTTEAFEQPQSVNEFGGTQIKGNRRRSSRKTSSPLLLYAGISLFLITGGAAFAFWDWGNEQQVALKTTKTVAAEAPANPAATTAEQPKLRPPAKPKPIDSMRPDWGPQNPKPNPPTDAGEGTPPAEPKPMEPKPMEPKPAPKPIEPAELVKLTAALKLGRTALSERNLEITAEQLAIAAPLARSGEPRKAFIRLKTMHQFLEQFLRLSNEAIDGYKGGSEIKLSESNTIVVVETTPQDVTIRVAGTVKTYLRNQLSSGLAIGIANTNFEESKYKSTLKAAFVITQKTLRDFDVERAREFWEMGPEPIELFEGYITDDYEFASE